MSPAAEYEAALASAETCARKITRLADRLLDPDADGRRAGKGRRYDAEQEADILPDDSPRPPTPSEIARVLEEWEQARQALKSAYAALKASQPDHLPKAPRWRARHLWVLKRALSRPRHEAFTGVRLGRQFLPA